MLLPGPMIAIGATASSIAGSASTMSIGPHDRRVSTHPPWYPAYRPSGTPTRNASNVEPTATPSETRYA